MSSCCVLLVWLLWFAMCGLGVLVVVVLHGVVVLCMSNVDGVLLIDDVRLL